MKNQIRTIWFAFFSSRIICAIFVYLGHLQREYLSPVNGGWQGVANWWLNPWTTFDSEKYLDIALHGYQGSTTPFFPLYPILMNLCGNTEISMVIAGLIISNLCFLAALNILFRLTATDFGEQMAKTTVWLLAFFPTTAFFSAVYSESLFLLLLLLTFYYARQQRWKFAGVFGFLAAITRNPGALISAALAIEYFSSLQPYRRNIRCPDLFAVFLPVLGLALVQGFYWYIFGHPWAGITSQEIYGREIGWPWNPVWDDLISLFTPYSSTFTTLVNVVFTILAFLLAIKYLQKTRISYIVLMLGIVLMHLTYSRTPTPRTIGSVRYLSTAFPFVQLLGLSLTHLSKNCRQVAAGLYLYAYIVFSYFFGLKGFLG